MPSVAQQFTASITSYARQELLTLPSIIPGARFAEIKADDDPHEFGAYLGRVTDTNGKTLAVGQFYNDLNPETVDNDPSIQVVDDILTWIGYEHFRGLGQEVYGIPAYFPASVLRNAGNTWHQHEITYDFDLDAVAATPA